MKDGKISNLEFIHWKIDNLKKTDNGNFTMVNSNYYVLFLSNVVGWKKDSKWNFDF